MSWSNNNLAHIYTDSAFASLGQYSQNDFSKVGKIKMKSLKFHPGTNAGAASKNQAALAMATMLDGIMNQWVNGTQYEDNFGPAKAIKKIAGVLKDGEKTVEEVADAVDASFYFAGEIANV